MAYSRRRYWLALGAALAIGVAALILRPHSAVMTMTMAIAVAAICGPLAFLSYFSLDEIQRQNEIRAWYCGGLLASLFALTPLLLLMSNPMLEAMAGLLPNASRMAPDTLHSPRIYFCMGMVVMLAVQAIGHFIAHAIFKVAGRAR
jgi:hypothetical protein